MNNVKLILAKLEELISSVKSVESLTDSAAIYAVVRIIILDIDNYINSKCGEDGYAYEKAGQIKWHVGAALGFDVDNGHNREQHVSWALGSLNSLKSTLEKYDSVELTS